MSRFRSWFEPRTWCPLYVDRYAAINERAHTEASSVSWQWLHTRSEGLMRLRFTIRTLLITAMVFATCCAWYAMKWQQLQRRYHAIAHLEKLSGPVSWYDQDSDFQYLHRIELQGKLIDETLWKEVSVLTEARTVSLSETNVTDDDLNYLRRFWNIRDLYLSNTSVTSEGIKSLTQLTTLETLIISNTSIDDRAIESLTQLKNLSTLNVWGTNISTSGIDQLRLALPNVRLFHDGRVGDPSDEPKDRASRFDNGKSTYGAR